jgi:hypothetical protein
MPTPSTNEAPQNPRVLLEIDHRHIDELFDDLRVRMRCNDNVESLAAWQRAEDALLAHMNVEEMFVVPLIEDRERADAGKIRCEHAEIRRALGELGMAFELHTARYEEVEPFLEKVHEHAAREEALYAYAERDLPASTTRSIVGRLERAAGIRQHKYGAGPQNL